MEMDTVVLSRLEHSVNKTLPRDIKRILIDLLRYSLRRIITLLIHCDEPPSFSIALSKYPQHLSSPSRRDNLSLNNFDTTPSSSITSTQHTQCQSYSLRRNTISIVYLEKSAKMKIDHLASKYNFKSNFLQPPSPAAGTLFERSKDQTLAMANYSTYKIFLHFQISKLTRSSWTVILRCCCS